jgi:hypothetical protein
MARRRRSSSEVDLQAVLRFLADADEPDYQTIVTWVKEVFGCKERAAKDTVSILAKRGWVGVLPIPADRRRKRYVLTEKGRSDMSGSFGQGALARGRRHYSTCLSGTGRQRQAATRAAGPNDLAEALEAEARLRFSGRKSDDLIRTLGTTSRPLRRRRPSALRTRLRVELLGEGQSEQKSD